MTEERRIRRVTADTAKPIQTAHGDEQPWADVVEDLSWREIKVLRAKAPLDKAEYDAAAAAIARYVVNWNIPGRNEDGELEPLPAPADDPESFDCAEPWVISWLFVTMHRIHITRTETEKKLTTSEPTPDGRNGDDSDSPPPASSPSVPTTTTS